ncbi:retropepsin-like aspartic protease [Brevundimonas lenta]|uniref:Peptidase A2 domain-containing protein n=1 Tax=Brevundimonas lenta TaxID=424796 RepID=A0A7W6NPR9_9CAUL|nr:retropepsin-like aspartic protease [Brevundimonas lenta]MBB4083700.1 hypothetical protein [Brevundimonas lenta]
MRLAAAVALISLAAAPVCAQSVTVPFDPHGGSVALDLVVDGRPLVMLLDTGVDPSVVDLETARALGLPLDGPAGAAEGVGDGDAAITPVTVRDLRLGDLGVPAVEAVAMDMAPLRARYGKPLDGVLGYSFLSSRIVLIDYIDDAVSVLDTTADAAAQTAVCRSSWRTPLVSFADDTIPVIPVRFGDVEGPASIDTGSNGTIGLLQSGARLLDSRLTVTGEARVTGARGATTNAVVVLDAPVSFGPFVLPAGQTVRVRRDAGSPETRIANLGNGLFRALGLKMLLDYPAKQMTFYGDCRA